MLKKIHQKEELELKLETKDNENELQQDENELQKDEDVSLDDKLGFAKECVSGEGKEEEKGQKFLPIAVL